jgi:hypothetical protein
VSVRARVERVQRSPALSRYNAERQELALRHAEECEREAAKVANASWREQWLDLARQWRELAAEARPRGDGDKS